jgi:hypothetical protein
LLLSPKYNLRLLIITFSFKYGIELPRQTAHSGGMDRKEWYGFGTGRYAYAEIERGLGATLGAGEKAQKGALRGRLKRLSTLGLPSEGPGKGKRRLYSWEEANQLLIALLMEDAGLNPVSVVPAIKNTWPRLANKVRLATSDKALAGNPVWLKLQLQTITGPWITKDPLSAVPWIAVVPRYDERSRTLSAKHQFKDGSDNIVNLLDDDRPGWFAVRNLTAEVSKLQAALHGGRG